MDRNAHTELTLTARDHRDTLVACSRLVESDKRHAEARKAALIAARKAVARKRSFVSRLISFFKA